MALIPFDITPAERTALERLLQIASDNTHQARRVAAFLLAWWNAGECGAFDITTAWGVDDAAAEDMVTVFRLAVQARHYPDTLGYGPQFEAIAKIWQPELDTHLCLKV